MKTKKKILLAEDDQFLGNAYSIKLSKSGFKVELASDGEKALELLASFTPDAMLLDLMLPKQDGFTILKIMGKSPKFKKIPVIVASNLGQQEDIDRAMKLGAKNFIVKSDLSLKDLDEKILQLFP